MTDASPKKSTIYVDAEDEITAIIEKVRGAKGSVVALVPPKRAPALQSVVNLKLLQRAAKTAKKNVVLVTSEPSLLPLAGTVGMHVAKTPSSKPEIPEAPKLAQTDAEDAEVVETGEEPELDPAKPIGELAGGAATAKSAPKAIETVDLDLPGSTAAAQTSKKASKPNKKLKVPNFNKFRNKAMLIGAGLVVLILLFVLANVVLPRANIVIKTDTSNVTLNLDLTASTSASEANPKQKTVPAERKEVKKSDEEKAPATGQRDDGTKAKGSVTFSVECSSIEDGPPTIPKGTAISSDGLSFITQSSVTLSNPQFSPCRFTGSTNVVAQQNGDQYNLSERSYEVSEPDVSAYGSTMSGGTSKIVKIVSQSDIDGVKNKILDKVKAEAEKELNESTNEDGVLIIKESIKAGEPVVTASPAVKSEATEVTVNVSVTYTALTVKKDDLSKLVEEALKGQIDTNKQMMQDAGLDTAVFRLGALTENGATFQLQTVAIAGPLLDEEAIKQDVAGQKRGETTNRILARPGIKDVEINYSPFWVYSTPKNTGKIKITFEKADGQQ